MPTTSQLIVPSLALRAPEAAAEHLVSKRLKQEQVKRLQPQSLAAGVSRAHSFPAPGPSLRPGASQIRCLDEHSLLLIPALCLPP